MKHFNFSQNLVVGIRRQWLVFHITHSSSEALFSLFFRCEPSNRNNQWFGVWRLDIKNCFGGHCAIHDGHVDVHKDQLVPVASPPRDSLSVLFNSNSAIFSFVGGYLVPLAKFHEYDPVDNLVVNYEDGRTASNGRHETRYLRYVSALDHTRLLNVRDFGKVVTQIFRLIVGVKSFRYHVHSYKFLRGR